jgi:hypothetical protein
MSKYLHPDDGRRDNSRRGVTAKKADPHAISPTDPILTSPLWAVPERYPAFKAWREGIDWGKTS